MAERDLQDRLTQQPSEPDLHIGLALTALHAGTRHTARAHLLRALAIEPLSASIHANLAIAFDGAEADAAMRRALALAPAMADLHANLAAIGRFPVDRRIAHGRRALALLADDAAAMVNLALALGEAGRLGEAISVAATAAEATPFSVHARFTLGGLLADAGRTTPASRELRRASTLAPGDAGVWLRLGRIMSGSATPLAAVRAVARAVAIDPRDPAAWSTYLMASLYDHGTTPARELALARARRRADGRPRLPRPQASRFDTLPLRIGYLSADFWEHPVAYNIAPAIAAHDRSRVCITCYADVVRRDGMTARLSEIADRWIEVSGLDDEALARRIKTDEIDILVVLAGHTARNRLGVASLRPAPIQLSLLDVASSGSPDFDGIVVDPLLCPPSLYSALTEKPLLVSCLFCFTTPDSPPPTTRHLDHDGIVFGSFSNPAKLGSATIALWAPLLRAVPDARLVLKYKNLYGDRAVQMTIRRTFADAGIEADRIDFSTDINDRQTHLEAYRRIDVALDPVPFNGCTTSFEALWMGVPVVTRAGERMMGRMGASILTAAGLDDLVVPDDEAFLACGLALVAAKDRRRALRQDLRRILRNSRLVDGRPLARELESVFEDVALLASTA